MQALLAALWPCCFLVIGTLGLRVQWQFLDTAEWEQLSSDLIDNPDVREAVAFTVVEILYAKVDVGAELDAALPRDLQGLGGAAAGALRGPFTSTAEDALGSEAFRTIWTEANALAHEALLAIVLQKDPDGEVREGMVTIHLAGMFAELAELLGFDAPIGADESIPVGVIDVDKVSPIRTAVTVVDGVVWLALIVLGREVGDRFVGM